jgi:hypothetical protein
MNKTKRGIFEYVDPLAILQEEELPGFLRLPFATSETVLLRLLLGHLYFSTETGRVFNLRRNFFFLPYTYKKAPKLTYISIRDSISDLLSDGVSVFNFDRDKESLKKYLELNRKNSEIYKFVLFELSSFLYYSKSATSAFVHLYRCLEYLSYSFPLIYAAKSRSYKGSFKDLKNFLSGDSTGELKFFKRFVDVLFEGEAIKEYVFEMNISIGYSLSSLKSDMEKVYQKFPYSFEDSVLGIEFKHMLDFLITTRNRYFHMLIGEGQNNFASVEYDISDYFKCINFHLFNWVAMIIQKITVFGFYSSLGL